jgi:thiamine biosynthesis lipoprotein
MKKIGLLIIVLLSLAACNPNKTPTGKWENIFVDESIIASDGYSYLDPFNTVMYVRYFVEDSKPDEKEKVQQIYTEEVVKLHKLFDRHYTYYVDDKNKELGLITNVNRINASYGKDTSLIIDEQLFDVIKLGIEYTKISQGKFNILVGTLSSFWEEIFNDYENSYDYEEIDPKFVPENNEKMLNITACIPTYEEIDQVLVLNEEEHSIKFNSIVRLDAQSNNLCANKAYQPSITLGGIGKGYATKVIVDKLAGQGYKNGFLLSGGSSISALGPSFLENGQRVTVADPRSTFYEDKVAFEISLKKKFDISTSGNYTTGKSYRFIDFENEEIVYRHHILNPCTGLPSNYHRSVTVYSETVDAGTMDAISTILVNMTIEEGVAFQKSMKEKGVNFEVVWVDQEGLDIKINCQADSWCPTYPSKLTVASTSNFNKTLKVTEGVKLNYVS